MSVPLAHSPEPEGGQCWVCVHRKGGFASVEFDLVRLALPSSPIVRIIKLLIALSPSLVCLHIWEGWFFMPSRPATWRRLGIEFHATELWEIDVIWPYVGDVSKRVSGSRWRLSSGCVWEARQKLMINLMVDIVDKIYYESHTTTSWWGCKKIGSLMHAGVNVK